VEILLNCVWLMFGLSLIATWSALGRRQAVLRSAADAHSQPSRRVQFVALLMLVILLFPVISLTDDLARCTAPQETERALRLHDRLNDALDASPSGPALLPTSTVWTQRIAAAFRQVSHQPVEAAVELSSSCEATRLPVESRPPPAAL
jgi:hypothetical protein